MIGTRIGPWILEVSLGRGTTGQVFRARNSDPEHPILPAVAAVKLLDHPTACQPAFLERFPGELLALARLTHPNIAKYYDSGVHAGLAYYATEYVEGTDLGTRISTHAKTATQPGLSWPTTLLSVAVQAARALKHAHHRSLLHRDLKPSQFILSDAGQLKITDFGVAKIFNFAPLLLPGDAMNTAGFLAPEHYAGKALTRRSDLYSLGGVLYTLLAGRPPFVATTALEFMHKHCYALPDRPANFVPKLPPEVDEFVCQLLAKDPARRPASAAALIEDLDRIRGKLERKGVVVVFPPAPDDPTGTHTPLSAHKSPEAAPVGWRRDRMLRAGILATLLLLVCGVILFAFFRPRASAKELWTRAAPLVASADPADWDEAREVALDELADRYPTEYTAEIQAVRQKLKAWRELRRAVLEGSNIEPTSEAERQFTRGLRFAQLGDYAGAKRSWDGVGAVFGHQPEDRRWVELASLGLRELSLHPRKTPARPSSEIAEELRNAVRNMPHGGQRDTMLKAIDQLYADQPEIRDALGQVPN